MEQPLSETRPAVITFNLMPLVVRIVKGRRTIVLSAVVCALLGAALSFLIKPWYRAETQFLPPKQDLSAAPSFSFFSAGSDMSDLYLGMLRSRTVVDDVIDHVNLMQVYKARMRDNARAQLAANSTFSVEKNSIITVAVKASTPELAAQIANAYTNALYRLNGEMASSGSAFRTEFLEKQLQFQRQELTQADVALKQTEERSGVVLPAGEAQANISSTAQLQNEINLQESHLAALLVSETEQNPEVQQTETSLAKLRSALSARRSSEQGSGLASNAKLPALTLENEERTREVKLREAAYAALAAQYEKTRAAALDPGPQLQIISPAIPPEQKAGPPRRLLVMGGFFLGGLLALIYVALSGPVRRIAADFRRAYVQG